MIDSVLIYESPMPLESSFLIATYIQCHVSAWPTYVLSLPAWLQLLSISVSANQDTASNAIICLLVMSV